MLKTKLLLLLLCACLTLTGCTATTLAAKDAVPLSAGEETVPPIDHTQTFDGKTLYQYYSENEDTIGWLTIDGIKTDHIVMLGQADKKYDRGTDGANHYLSYNFAHQSSSYGELYIDYRCHITYGDMSQNLTVYGHHMKDGTMLAGLDYYKRQSYFQDHQYITFHTLWGTYHFRIFGIFTVNLKVASDAAFDYRQPEYESEEAFLSFIDAVKQRSYYDTGVAVKGDDRIITLSTCTYPTGNPSVDDARLVVMGRLCTPEEEAALAQTGV